MKAFEQNKLPRLHLGCGSKEFPGWTHVDALRYPHVDHVGPVEDLSFAPTGSVAMIYASHVLEHFGRHEVRGVLKEWRRVLAPGGILRLAVPDFQACAELYLNNGLANGLNDIVGLIVGGQRDQYDYHKMIFDRQILSQILIDAEFKETRLWDWENTDHSHIDDYSQAFIPHMSKATGRLVSLNMEAIA